MDSHLLIYSGTKLILNIENTMQKVSCIAKIYSNKSITVLYEFLKELFNRFMVNLCVLREYAKMLRLSYSFSFEVRLDLKFKSLEVQNDL